MEHPNPTPGPAAPGAAHGAGGKAPKTVELDKLPFALRGILAWLPESEWNLVNAVICHGALIRELVDVTKFLDPVWTHSKNSEDRMSSDRVTGSERDAYRARVEQAIKEIATVAVELARRSRLTEILQRNRPLVVRYVPDAVGKPGPKPGRKSEQLKKPAPPPAAPPASPPGPDLLNRWLTGIRRIRESDPSFARASEVLSMFEKALEGSGARRVELEHMLAQYKEAMTHAGEGADSPPVPATEAA